MAATYINGVELRSRGLVVERLSRWTDLPTRTLQTAQILGQMGEVVIGVQGYRPRGLVLEGTIIGSSYADRVSKVDPLKALVGGQAARITRYDGTNWRTTTGYLLDGPITPIGTEMRTRGARTAWQFLCPDPVWSDVDPMLRHCITAGEPYDCHVGTAPSDPVIEVFGGATNPEVQIRDAANNLRYRLRFTTTLTTAQSIEIDQRTGRIWHYSSGVRTDGMPYLNPADLSDLAALTLDPQDGANVGAVYAQVTSGRMRVMWWRHWL